MKRSILVTCALFVSSTLVHSQDSRPVPYPVFYTPQFEDALLSGTRSSDGTPGPEYWTNTAVYDMDISVAPGSNTLRGRQVISYKNNSAVALGFLLIHLRQNVYREGVPRNRSVEVTGGVQIGMVSVNGQPVLESSVGNGVGYFTQGTRMRLGLVEPLAPGGSVSIEMTWSYQIPESSFRNGQDGEVYYIAYWYPQIAVLDDVNGWKADPYMGNGEFYMGYADYDVSITAPQGYLVAATGALQNPSEVLATQTLERLARASDSDETVHIVKEKERRAGLSTTTSSSGALTWRFSAENVRDFAFGFSDKYVWDATSAVVGDGERSMIHAFYRPEKEVWKRSAEFSKFSIEHLSRTIMPYPYPHMTTVEGIIGGGMEYPMMTLIGGNRNDRSLFGVTYHEISHMWFPMIVGQDEKENTWMDEGLTSFNTANGSEEFWKDEKVWSPERQSYYRIAGSGREVEPMRHGDLYPSGSPARGIASYNKPAVGMHALRGILGEEVFEKAYREYARRWAYKHPTPFDLFNTFEDVAGMDLDWFWTSFFYQTWTLDQGVGSVIETASGTELTIEDYGLSPMPVDIQVTYKGGKSESLKIPVEHWLQGNRSFSVTLTGGEVAEVVLDPESYLPDVNRDNNAWTSNARSGDSRN